jgi:hypothetical protein
MYSESRDLAVERRDFHAQKFRGATLIAAGSL